MTQQFNNPIPVAVALIKVANHQQKELGLLVGRRCIAPCIGEYAFPGGYVDEKETAEVAVSREVREETGIILPPEQFYPVTTRVTPQNRLLIFLGCHTTLLVSDLVRFIPNLECDALKYALASEQLAFPLHTEVLHNPKYWD